MGRIYAKTIVSSKTELPYVAMNLAELSGVVDEFLICESNMTHTGEFVGHKLKKFFMENLAGNNIRFIEVDLRTKTKPWSENSDDLHFNEQLIRNGFTHYIRLEDDDIVISMDADEVLFRNRTRTILKRLNRRFLNRGSYVLKLNQVIYKISYKWIDCDFRGPIIAKASYFLQNENPQWRYEGFPTLRKSGTHFTWIMTPEDMVKKIKRYSHRVENEKFAEVSLLKESIANKKYPFEANRPFNIVVSKKFTERYYPRSLRANLFHFPEELI